MDLRFGVRPRTILVWSPWHIQYLLHSSQQSLNKLLCSLLIRPLTHPSSCPLSTLLSAPHLAIVCPSAGLPAHLHMSACLWRSAGGFPVWLPTHPSSVEASTHRQICIYLFLTSLPACPPVCPSTHPSICPTHSQVPSRAPRDKAPQKQKQTSPPPHTPRAPCAGRARGQAGQGRRLPPPQGHDTQLLRPWGKHLFSR